MKYLTIHIPFIIIVYFSKIFEGINKDLSNVCLIGTLVEPNLHANHYYGPIKNRLPQVTRPRFEPATAGNSLRSIFPIE